MRVSFRKSIIVATAIVGLGAFAASAAPPAAGDPTAVHPSSGQLAVQGKPAAGGNVETKTEQRISDLHAKLKISPAQQPQWDSFAQVMRDNATRMDAAFQRRVEAMPTMTAVDNMQSYADFAEQHAQDVQKLVPAFKALYDSMSDAQKRMADQVFRDDAHRGNSTAHS
jgi:hypothetical protein